MKILKALGLFRELAKNSGSRNLKIYYSFQQNYKPRNITLKLIGKLLKWLTTSNKVGLIQLTLKDKSYETKRSK